MQKKYTLFIPWKSKFACSCNSIRLKHDYKQKQFYFEPDKKTFFSIKNERVTAKCFIEAVLQNSFKDAGIYISKSQGINFNFDEIKELFESVKKYNYAISVSKKSKYEKVTSVFITDSDFKNASVLNIYLTNEPDRFSKWKIYRIEKEARYERAFKSCRF